jgi:hypothetical protein
MLKRRNMLLMAILVAGGVATAGTLMGVRSERADCPGRIVCPLTGQAVCKDRCPLGESSSSSDVPACCAQRGGQ